MRLPAIPQHLVPAQRFAGNEAGMGGQPVLGVSGHGYRRVEIAAATLQDVGNAVPGALRGANVADLETDRV
jgi:hypothetical protein